MYNEDPGTRCSESLTIFNMILYLTFEYMVMLYDIWCALGTSCNGIDIYVLAPIAITAHEKSTLEPEGILDGLVYIEQEGRLHCVRVGWIINCNNLSVNLISTDGVQKRRN
jgi:hypothetical protein